jgi:nicotinamidase-related amidase
MTSARGLIADLQVHMPVRPGPYALGGRSAGLVVVDEIHGFCTVGAGPMAPVAHDPQIVHMIEETARLAHRFAESKQPILVFLDTHEPGKPEFPYPLHCEIGSGEEELVPQLQWLERCSCATLLRKDCIDGFVGGIEAAPKHGMHHNKVVDWVNSHRVESLVVVGICTDICVMDFVLSMLSARNHGMMPTLSDIVVYEPATATYDLPREAAEEQGLAPTLAHPKAETHHMGLYFMASRGATLASELA